MAEFEGRQWQPTLPPHLRWRAWSEASAEDVSRVLLHNLPEYAAGIRSQSESALAAYLSAIADPLRQVFATDVYAVPDVVRWFGALPFETSSDRRLFLELFDEIIADSLDRGERQFISTNAIADLAVAIADPRPGERIYDPCFGYGGLLTAAWEHALKRSDRGGSRQQQPPLSVSGVEIRSTGYLVGLARLILAGVEEPHLELGNSLEREPAKGQKGQAFDVVLANPPINARFADTTSQYFHFPVRTKDSTSLFIQHVLLHMGKGGRAVVAVPDGFLHRGAHESRLRRYLVQHGNVEAVVALPEGAFAPQTMVKGSLLVLRNEGRSDQIRMLDARPFFRKATSGRGLVLPPEQLQELIWLYRETWVLPDDQLATSSVAADLRSSVKSDKTERLHVEDTTTALWAVSAKELAISEWDLTPRRREKGRLDDLLSTLSTALKGAVRVRPLGECSHIIAGRGINSADLTEVPEGDSPARYIRIKDIVKGVASEGSSWVSGGVLSSIDPKNRLQPGDVVLAKSGTIGKAGIVRNGAIGGIVTSGLYVIRVDKEVLDPHFLLAYLSSPASQSWLLSQSRGAVIQHLSRRVLAELPIPLPALSIQQRAVAESREYGTDPIDFLINDLGAAERDIVAPIIEKSLVRLRTIKEASSDPLDLSFVEPLVESVRQFRNRAAHGQLEGPLGSWVISFWAALSRLRDLSRVPRGPALFSLLRDSSKELRRVRDIARGSTSVEAQARRLNDAVADLLERGAAALLGDVNIVFTPDTSTVQLGEVAEIGVTVENRGVLPVRDLFVLTTPDWGHMQAGFVQERGSVRMNLQGVGPKAAGVFSITVSWTAQTLDGETVEGERQLSFSVEQASITTREEAEDLGPNPYITGTPVYPERDDVFFGRASLIEQISRQVATSGNVVLLEGNRRTGKSSILHHLKGASVTPGWLGVYCSLQGAEGDSRRVGVPTAEVFRSMAISIASEIVKLGLDTPLPNGVVIARGKPVLGIGRACREGISEAAPFTDFRDYLECVLSLLSGQSLGILMMLDEFDKLQEGIDHGVTSPQVPENIRFLVQSYPSFSAILTGSRRLKRMREEYWSALYGLGTRFGVSALEPEDARRLVVEPVKGKLTYSPEAVDRAIALTARQPYLLQCLCTRIFDFAAQTRSRSITADIVEQASRVLVKDNEHFASLWDYAGSCRRRLILLLCSQRATAAEQLSFGELQELLTQKGIELTDEELDADLAFLRELELIDLVGTSIDVHYRLSIPLMSAWMESHEDFDVVVRQAQAEAEEQNV